MFFIFLVSFLGVSLTVRSAEVSVIDMDDPAYEKDTGMDVSPGSNREEKFLSVFQIVKFQNGACPATSGDTGVCFTEAECSAKGGIASGSCASSFGVCCVFTVSTCGGTVTQNNTYIQSPNYPSMAPAGMCMYNINKCDSNICQLRLDFEDVSVSGPAMGDCNNDTITISQVDAQSEKVVPMSLCGTLSGQHMILNVKDQDPGAKITFNIVSMNSDTRWRIKVTQIACDDDYLLAPCGCLTYHTGTSGTLQSYNNQNGAGELINNQKWSHCIKCQPGFCDVALTQSNFELGPGDDIVFGNNVQTLSNFGSAGSLLWNFTGPYVATSCSNSENTAMNAGYNIGYLMLPC